MRHDSGSDAAGLVAQHDVAARPHLHTQGQAVLPGQGRRSQQVGQTRQRFPLILNTKAFPTVPDKGKIAARGPLHVHCMHA